MVVAIGLGFLTWRRNQNYRSEVTLWLDTVAKFPNDPLDHDNLGMVLRLDPNIAGVHNNLGIALTKAGRLQEAIGHFEQALRINPDSATAHNNLGNALLQAGRPEDAIRQYQQALQSNPGSAAGYYNLGNALLQAGRPKEAIGQYEEAVRLDPGLTPARDILARLRASQ